MPLPVATAVPKVRAGNDDGSSWRCDDRHGARHIPTPGVYPRGAPRPTTSRAEQALHRELVKQLPKGWTAWHSLRIRSGAKLEGEGDFIVAVPGRGILVWGSAGCTGSPTRPSIAGACRT